MALKTDHALSCIEVNSHENTSYSIIWLHGLGADGSDFLPIVNELRLPSTIPMRFIFPEAPIMPITINHGYEMRAWYDIRTSNLQAEVDQVGIRRSIRQIEQLIEAEIARGTPSTNIILAGFSQGGVLALTTGLNYKTSLGGIIVLSAYLPWLDDTAPPTNNKTPIFIGHGTEDPLVPQLLGQQMFTTLKQAGYPVSWHSYPIEHSVSREEIADISQWIQNVLK